MLTWMSKNRRKAARPAAPAPIKPPARPAVDDEDELPPPFFADADPAFLDLGDDPPAAPAVQAPTAVAAAIGESMEARLAKMVLELPAFPARDQKDRTRQLLSIYRQLDRIAAEAGDGGLSESR